MKNIKPVILLVENDPADQFLIKQALNQAFNDIKLIISENGKSAIDNLEKMDLKLEPDLILLDLNMEIMGGKEFLKNLKSNQIMRKIPVVMLTTSDHFQDIEDCYNLGASGYIHKPLESNVLVEKFEIMRAYWYEVCLLPS